MREYYCPDCKGILKQTVTRVIPHTNGECIANLKVALTTAQEENKRYRDALERVVTIHSRDGGELSALEMKIVAQSALNGGK